MPTTVRQHPKPLFRKPATAPSRGPVELAEDFRGLGIFLFGPPGIGKTIFAAQFTKVGFIIDDQEEGILDLKKFKQVDKSIPVIEVSDWEQTLEQIDNFPKTGCKTLALDSATGFEKYCFAYHCREQFGNDWSKEGFYAFQQGPKNAAKTDWPAMLGVLDSVRRNGINVIFIGHSQIKAVANPEGIDYEQFVPYLDKETWAQTHRWAQSVMFMNKSVVIRKDKSTGGKNKPDFEQSGERFLYLEETPAFKAKQRFGIPSPIHCGSSGAEAYQNFMKELKKVSS